MPWNYIACFGFYRDSQLRVCPESQNTPEFLKMLELLRLWEADSCIFSCVWGTGRGDYELAVVFIWRMSMVQGEVFGL